MKNIYTICFTLIICLGELEAQETSYFFGDSAIISTYINPALPLNKKVQVGLANLDVGWNSGDISYGDIVSKNAAGNRYLDPVEAKLQLGGIHQFSWYADIRTLDLGFRFKKFGILLGHGFRHLGQVAFSSDLLLLYLHGNEPYIGKTLNLEVTPDINAYNELYVGGQYYLKTYTFGIKYKLLYGIANSNTEASKLDLTTDENYYELFLDKDYTLRSSGLVNYFENDSITIDFPRLTFDNLFYNNRGFALDLGFSGKVSSHVDVSLSVTDLGRIKWDFTPRKFTAQGQSKFSGFDILQFTKDTTGFSIQDSLSELLNIERSIETYTTPLGGMFTLGGKYITKRWTFGGIIQYNALYTKPIIHSTISAIRKFKFLEVGASGSIYPNSIFNIGLMAKVNMDPIAFYFSLSNVPGIFNIERTRNNSGSFGLMARF